MQGAAANSCKEFGATGPSFLVLPSSPCYLPRAGDPLTTIYRVERRSLRNQFLLRFRGRNFKNFSVFPLLPLPRAFRSPLCRVVLLSLVPGGAAQPLRDEEREREGGLLRGFAEWLIYQINPAANFQLIISALTHRENVTWLSWFPSFSAPPCAFIYFFFFYSSSSSPSSLS